LAEVEKYVDAYDSILAACGDTYSKAGLEYAQTMDSNSSFLTTSAESLLTSEISRSEQVQQKIQADFERMMLVIIVIVVIAVILASILALSVSGSIVKPVRRLQGHLAVMTEGDLTQEDIKVKSMDEVGHATLAFNKMKGNLVHIIREVVNGTDELQGAIATVNCSIEENAKGSTRIAEAVEEMFGSLEQQKTQIQHLVDQSERMDRISGQVASDAESIYARAEETKNNADVGMEKLMAYVEQMQEVNASMQEIRKEFATFGDSMNEMTCILDSIMDIATQTNLLSLNASIEAARAGDAGKGFSVVATEIRSLADDSQAAASRIAEMIANVTGEADAMSAKLQEGLDNLEKGNQMTNDTKESFSVIRQGTDEVGHSVESIMERVGALSTEIETELEHINSIDRSAGNNVTEMNEISAIVTEEGANLQEVSDAMNKLLTLTDHLEEMVSEFRL
jgi:methyl-accepting chemotaxis protein